jgi:hypothetical protein
VHQFDGLRDAHRARARRIEHEADRVGAEIDGLSHIGLLRQTAQLDARAMRRGLLLRSGSGVGGEIVGCFHVSGCSVHTVLQGTLPVCGAGTANCSG